MIYLPEPIPTTMLQYHARSSLKYTWSSWKKHIGRGWNWQKTLLDLNSRKVGVCAAVSQGSCDRTVLRFYQVGLISTNSRNLHKKRLNLRILLARFGRTQSRTLLYWVTSWWLSWARCNDCFLSKVRKTGWKYERGGWLNVLGVGWQPNQ